MKKFKWKWLAAAGGLAVVFGAWISIGVGLLMGKGMPFQKLQNPPQVEIYNVYHRNTPIFQNDVVIPIQAGRALNTEAGRSLRSLMIGDDTGDNISLKNDRYAELTALYWMWKNSKADYVGLMHYRRSFIVPHQKNIDCPKDDHLCDLGLTRENLTDFLQNYDIVVPKKVFTDDSNYDHYASHHNKHDMDDTLNYIRRTYPEMADTVARVMASGGSHSYNMFIMKKEILNDYAVWLFDVLDAVEAKIENRHLTEDWKIAVNELDDRYYNAYRYRRRAPGFISEHLFTIWLAHNGHKYRIKELDVEFRELWDLDVKE